MTSEGFTSANQRRHVALHETGHAHGIGHLTSAYFAQAIMPPGTNSGIAAWLYQPTQVDVDLINQIYP